MSRKIRLKTPLGPDALVIDQMVGADALSTAFEFQLQLISDDSNIELSSLLGQKATVEVDYPLEKGGMRYFNGYIADFTFLGTFAGPEKPKARYQMTLRPWLWLLSMQSNCKIFQNETVLDIVKAVWRQHGFSDFREALTGTYQPWEYCVQYRESDFNFTTRLLEQEGIYYYFEHEDGKHTLVLADSPSAHKPTPNYAKIPYYPEGHQSTRDYLSTWSVGRKMNPGAYVHTEYDFTNPKADLSGKLENPAAHKLSAWELFDYPGEYETGAEGETQARVRLEEHQADYHVVRAGGGSKGVAVGAKFTLTDHPRADQNKEHLVVSASYELSPVDQGSAGLEGGTLDGTYTLIPAAHPYRAPSSTPKPRVDGPQTARVVGKKGEEIWTDKYGRIKVQFHWDREGKSDENSSCWIRVSSSWAGSRFGEVFLPRIGQEVIVSFLEGDPDRPIVTGRVYNRDNMQAYDLPARQTESGIRSHSTKGGSIDNYNEIRFEDLKGKELFYIQAEKDRTILVKNDEEHTVNHDRKKEVKNDEITKIGNNRTETVKVDETIEVGGNRMRKVTKNEIVAIEGELTRTVTKARTVKIGANDTLSVKGNRAVTISEGSTLTVTKNRTTQVDGNDSAKIGKTLSVVVAESITFKSGDASFTLKKDGSILLKGKKISIEGSDINIKGSGKVNVKAGGDVIIKGTKLNGN